MAAMPFKPGHPHSPLPLDYLEGVGDDGLHVQDLHRECGSFLLGWLPLTLSPALLLLSLPVSFS